jgi:serine protease
MPSIPVPRLGFPAVLMAAALLLTACGGGGGGNNNDNDAATSEPGVFSVSGTFQALSSTAMDADVNDPNAPLENNGEPELAQPLSNPVIVGGYVNLPGAGEPGRSKLVGDVVDFYRIALSTGQIVELSMAGDGVNDDVDIYLLDTNGEQVFYGAVDEDGNPILDEDGNQVQIPIRSIGQTRNESMTVREDGTYLIAAVPFAGASNYVMRVGQATGPAAAQAEKMLPQYVSGEVLVRFVTTPGTDGVRAGGLDNLEARAASLGLQAVSGAPGRPMLLRIGGAYRCASVFKQLGAEHLVRTFEQPGISAKLQLTLATPLLAKTLALREDVAAAAPNYIRRPLLTPNDELYPRQWHYPLINLPQAWGDDPSSLPGSGVIVAVIDTGVVLDHPDLRGQLVDGYDFIGDPESGGDGDGIDPDPSDPGDGISPGTSSFHGTHVTGTVVAATNNGIGVAGVAFEAKVMPLRILGRLGGTDADLVQAIRFAAGLDNDSGTLPAPRADIINMSLGGPGFSQVVQDTVTEARNAGLILVAAAGNAATAQPMYPAAFDGVVSVGALTITKALAPYSSFGTTLDVVAPGGYTLSDIDGDGFGDGVLSTGATDSQPDEETDEEKPITSTYLYLQGTSMASPHMAGVAALMKWVNPEMTPQDLDDLLASTNITEDLGTPGWDVEFGHGMINAFQAVTAATNLIGGPLPPDNPVLVVNPAALNFGLITLRANLSATNGSSGELKVLSVETDAPWLTVQGRNTDPQTGLGDYDVLLDRTGLAPGTYTATITFVSDANTVPVPFIMQVASDTGTDPVTQGDAGLNYVQLIDADSGETVQSFPVSIFDGEYQYIFPRVPEGSYRIRAGTDSDNDGFVGRSDSGEAWGVYRGSDGREGIVDVNTDITGLDFAVEFTFEFHSPTGTVSAGALGGLSGMRGIYPAAGPRRSADD